jgi:hypothetical protein
VSTVLGQGELRYEVAGDWGELPDGWALNDVAAVAVDGKDRVYVFNRGAHPMIVLDREGKFLRSWGEGVFTRAHGLHIGPDDNLYCTDDGDHTVRKCTPDGKLLHSWGEPGCDPGQFNIPHNIWADEQGWVYVADRENHRVQVFNGEGRYETQWNNLHRPCALCAEAGRNGRFFVGELGPTMPVNRDMPNLGPRITVVSHEGKLISRVGTLPAGTKLDQFVAPHGLALDSRGDLYVGEVSYTAWPQIWPEKPIPQGLRSLRKLVRVG